MPLSKLPWLSNVKVPGLVISGAQHAVRPRLNRRLSDVRGCNPVIAGLIKKAERTAGSYVFFPVVLIARVVELQRREQRAAWILPLHGEAEAPSRVRS